VVGWHYLVLWFLDYPWATVNTKGQSVPSQRAYTLNNTNGFPIKNVGNDKTERNLIRKRRPLFLVIPAIFWQESIFKYFLKTAFTNTQPRIALV
jgi:hypothetical protein